MVDEDGAPIPTAAARHPEEVDHHRGSAVRPYWIAQALHLTDGEELVFVLGLDLVLEVSAPGYASRTITHTVKRRKR